MSDRFDFKGATPESWGCIDCGINTAPGIATRVEMEKSYKTAAALARLSGEKKGGRVGANGGCLCIGCIERRLGRRLKPKDFPRRHPLNSLPGTERLIERQEAAR
jgi:hypothetical protein